MSGFYLPGSTATTASPSPLHSPSSPHHGASPAAFYGSDEDEEDTLPYPAPLTRSDFLSPDFSPQRYLSTLHNRHQTLEDLRSDLRARSQLLSKELLDLVNSNYEEFLSLGGTLKGGDDKVDEVKLGVLGFRREVEGVRDAVKERELQVRRLLEERRHVTKDVATGRKLLEIDDRLGELEERLMLEPNASALGPGHGDDDDEYGESEDDDDDDDDDNNPDESVTNEVRAASAAVARLRKHAQLYLVMKHMVDRIGAEHPFIVAQQARIARLRNTLLLDLHAALKQAKSAGPAGNSRTLKVVAIYRDLGEAGEGVKALKGL
ncbi:hypothetical protein MBLNU459_g3129t1 [Dothideomycetes sp. NU459]